MAVGVQKHLPDIIRAQVPIDLFPFFGEQALLLYVDDIDSGAAGGDVEPAARHAVRDLEQLDDE